MLGASAAGGRANAGEDTAKEALPTLRTSRSEDAAEARCAGPCSVYDPASVRIAAKAAAFMAEEVLALAPPANDDAAAWAAYENTRSRDVATKSEQANLAESELLVRWTAPFRLPHLELPDTLRKAADLFSEVTAEVSAEHAEGRVIDVNESHESCWEARIRDVAWGIAS